MEKKKTKTFEDLVDKQYGQPGTASRSAFEERAQMFLIAEMLKDARLEAGLTQQQLAEKIGTKKAYISRLENGKGDIQLSTLFRIAEEGLGRKVNIFIE